MLLLLDIDDFKQVNDKYGHLVGDKVLVEFAQLIKSNIRSNDNLTRWGGEEFIIALMDASESQAWEYAERLRKLIANHVFEIIGAITVSIGVAALGEDEGIDSLLKRVDEALYQAKLTTKNKVVFSRSCPDAKKLMPATLPDCPACGSDENADKDGPSG
jgi:diguanylate cyclase (GGDEF)-like protein